MQKPAFLRQEEDALAKLVDESEDDRSKLICLGDARPQSIRGGGSANFSADVISSNIIRYISRALAHSAHGSPRTSPKALPTNMAARCSPPRISPPSPLIFLAGEDRGLFAGEPGFRNFRCLS